MPTVAVFQLYRGVMDVVVFCLLKVKNNLLLCRNIDLSTEKFIFSDRVHFQVVLLNTG